MTREIKTDSLILVQRKHEDRVTMEKEEARAKRIEYNKRKTALSIIGGAIFGVVAMYFSMLFFLLL